MQRRFVSNLTTALREEALRVAPTEDNAHPTRTGNVNPTPAAELPIPDANRRRQEPPHHHSHLQPQLPEQNCPNLEQSVSQSSCRQSISPTLDEVAESQRSPPINIPLVPWQVCDPTQGVAQVPTLRVQRVAGRKYSKPATPEPIPRAIGQDEVTVNPVNPASDADGVIACFPEPEGNLSRVECDDVFDEHCGPYLEGASLKWPAIRNEGSDDYARYVRATSPQGQR